MFETLSYGLPVLESDIPANKEVKLPAERYFRCGNVADLKEKNGNITRKRIFGSRAGTDTETDTREIQLEHDSREDN